MREREKRKLKSEKGVVGLTALALACAISAFAGNPCEKWNMDALSKVPRTRPVETMSTDGVKALMIEGPKWRGRETWAFAYYAAPEWANPSNRAPGIVLVHGGLGTAYKRWVKLWKDRGYAAIAVDNCGGWPVRGEGADWLRHKWSGPEGWGGYTTLDEPVEDQWFYHAVSVSILSHTLLRSFPEVDTRAIGLTGISWGGILTCVIAGVDHRFAYAVPVYGCGFLYEHGFAGKQDDAARAKWGTIWDPSLYLPFARCPFLWVDGTNDFAFALDGVRQSAALVADSAFTTIVRMVHAHGAPGEDPGEILAFADRYARGGKDIVRITSAKTERGILTAAFDPNGRKVVKAELVWTADAKGDWKGWDRWYYETQDVPGFNPESRTVAVTVPPSARLWYVSLVTDDGLRFSTPLFGTPLMR